MPGGSNFDTIIREAMNPVQKFDPTQRVLDDAMYDNTNVGGATQPVHVFSDKELKQQLLYEQAQNARATGHGYGDAMLKYYDSQNDPELPYNQFKQRMRTESLQGGIDADIIEAAMAARAAAGRK